MKGTKRKHTRKRKRVGGVVHHPHRRIHKSAKKRPNPTPVATTKPTATPKHAVPGSLIGTWVSDRDGLGR